MNTQNSDSNTISGIQQQSTMTIKRIIENEILVRRDDSVSEKLFIPDAVIVTVHGVRLVGEAELRRFIQQSNESPLVNVRIKNEVTHISFLRPEVAIISAIQFIYLLEGDTLKEAGKGAMTFVMIEDGGRWLIAAAQNTLIQKLPFEWKG